MKLEKRHTETAQQALLHFFSLGACYYYRHEGLPGILGSVHFLDAEHREIGFWRPAQQESRIFHGPRYTWDLNYPLRRILK